MKHTNLIKIKRYYWLLLFLIPFLIGARSCSILLFLGAEEHTSPTAPCAERIPTPSPLPVTPVSSPAQEPEPEGTPLITGGTLVTPPPDILPPPQPWGLFSVFIQPPFIPSSAIKCNGWVSPVGLLEEIPEGTIIDIAVTTNGWCSSCSLQVDGVQHDLNCYVWYTGPYTYSLEVTGNHEVIPFLND